MRLSNKLFGLLPGKVTLWFSLFLGGAVYFGLFRLIFLLTHRHLISDVSIYDLIYTFWIGFRFDAVILSIIILPLYSISLLPWIDFKIRYIRIITLIFLAVIFSLSFLICTADLRFFDVFGSRINYWAVEYIEYPELFLYSATGDSFSLELILLWLLSTISFTLFINYRLNKSYGHHSSLSKLPKIALYLLVILLLAFGIRGRLGIKGLEWGSAFFSDNHIVNQTSLNGVYTLTRSIYEEWRNGRVIFGKNINRFKFYNEKEAYLTTADMLGFQPDMNNDSFNFVRIQESDNRLGFSPNIIIIIMESWSAKYVGSLGADYNVTPEFDRLSSRGISFQNFYANGVRTNRGIPAVLCSFPSLPGRSIMKRYAADYPFFSIAQILGKENYTSIFAYGGDIEFDNMRGFLKAVGYDTFYSEDDFGSDDILGKWGVPDHIMFDRMVHEIKNLPRPFNLSIMTLSNHEPFLLPDDRFKLYDDSNSNSRELNSFYYSDWALGQFISEMEKLPVFDSTIFIFTADHCTHRTSKYLLDPIRFHTPLLIFSPSILGDSAIQVEKTGSQVDILPTLLDILGITAEHSSWGRDLLSLKKDDPGFAVVVSGEKMGLIEADKFYVHWPEAVRELYDLRDSSYLEINRADSLPDLTDRMERRLKSYIQTANYLSRGGRRK